MLDAGGFVTRAPLHSARAARFGEGVSQSSRRHRQQKRSLLERYDKGRIRAELLKKKKVKTWIQFLLIWQTTEKQFKDNNVLSSSEETDANEALRKCFPATR